MKILAFDTTNSTLSVALLEDQKILSKNTIFESGKQSELLIPEIEKILTENNIWYQELDLIAATNGPGSFTGVRIGLTVAKSLKIATNKPLILINALEAIAFKHHLNRPFDKLRVKEGEEKGQIIFVAIDAKMDEFFIASFESRNGKLEPILESQLIKQEDIKNFLPKENHLLCGSAKNIISQNETPHEEIVEADTVGLLALEKFNRKDERDDDALYLRAPRITERKK